MADNIRFITTLHQLLDYDARKFSSTEIQLKKSLTEWINKAGSLKLKAVLQKYMDFVEQHIQKMEGFFIEEDINYFSITNKVMLAFIEEAEEKLSCCSDIEVKDACLLASVQVINHYKISLYGTAAAFANTLGMEKYAGVFHQSEVNEKQIDDRLSQLAEHEINIKARAPIVLPS